MATECRGTTKRKISKYKIVKAQAYAVLILLVLFGGLIGGFIGRKTAPTKVETVTVTEPQILTVYEADKLPEAEIITYYDVPLSHSLQNYIYEVCTDEKVPMSLVIAMIDYESNFNPEIVSDTDDYGLMQINRVNNEMLSSSYHSADMLDAYQNVFCGVKIIAGYINQYEDYNKALMAYNMGSYGAQKAWENGITSTTYSEQILTLMSSYEQEVKNNATSADNE